MRCLWHTYKEQKTRTEKTMEYKPNCGIWNKWCTDQLHINGFRIRQLCVIGMILAVAFQLPVSLVCPRPYKKHRVWGAGDTQYDG
jgi:hypothetical protein